jgi:type IV pilus assembly protein PilM
MALLGKQYAYLGLEIGSSSLKLVELINRHRRVEVATYAEANVANPLISPRGSAEDAVRSTANIISQMLELANVSTDATIAALPSSIVFSTVLTLPNLPEKKMNDAVHFAARDVVPAELDDMFLGWSKVGSAPHMEGEPVATTVTVPIVSAADDANRSSNKTVPVFITAAPRDVVSRYAQVMDLVGLELVALEVETFPLVRSLLTNEQDSAMIVDIGDQTTTYHVIDKGTARISHTINYGGGDLTTAIAATLKSSSAEANRAKAAHGLLSTAPEAVRSVTNEAVKKLTSEAQRLIALYVDQKHSDPITKTVLIGGGAKLPGLADVWAKAVQHKVQIGNPWRGLTYAQELQKRVAQIGPTYGVAIGLALRGINAV